MPLVARCLAVLFIIYGLAFAGPFALNVPPFLNADEGPHFERAAQVAAGMLVGEKFGPYESGGPLDRGIAATAAPFVPLIGHFELKATKAMFDAVAGQGWTGVTEMRNFSNTSIYSPVLYLPDAAAIRVGQALRMSVRHTLVLARFCNAVTSIGLSAAAIGLAGMAAPYLFLLLSLPMSLALMANASHDGLMLGCTALGVSLLIRARRQVTERPLAMLVVASLAWTAVAMARPSYVGLALLPLLWPDLRWLPRLGMSLLITLACVAWTAFAAHEAGVPLRPDLPFGNVAMQLTWIAANPGEMVRMLWWAIAVHPWDFVSQFVGRFGYLDAPLPDWYVALAALSLPVGVALSFGGRAEAWQAETPSRRLWVIGTVLAVILGSVVLTHLALFITWTSVGSATIVGRQGRYFIVPAIAVAAMLPLHAMRNGISLVRRIPLAVIALVPLLALAVTARTIVLRYYLS